MDIRCDIHADEALFFLNRFASGDDFRLGLYEGGVYLAGQASIYPPAQSRPQPMTDAQRRGFFAKLKAGEIVVPYPRGSAPSSETMSKHWNASPEGNRVVVG